MRSYIRVMSSLAILSALALPCAAQAAKPAGKAFEPPKGVKPVLRAGLIAASFRTRAVTRKLEKLGLPASVVAQPEAMLSELARLAPGASRSSVDSEGSRIVIGGAEFKTFGTHVDLRTVANRGRYKREANFTQRLGPSGIFEMVQYRDGKNGVPLERSFKRVAAATQLADGTAVPAGSWVVEASRGVSRRDSTEQVYVLPKGSSARPVRLGAADGDRLIFGR